MSDRQELAQRFQLALKITRDYEISNKYVVYDGTSLHIKLKQNEGVVKVLNIDCVEALQIYKKDKPLLLCMASEYHPGGGVKKGCNAQEELLCRISTLYTNLQKIKRYGMYPIKNPFIVKDVVFFKDQHHDNLKDEIICDVLMASAVKKQRGQKFKEEDVTLTLKKIKQMLTLAIQEGYKTVILSAFGCGAYNNPPEVVAECFKQILYGDEYIKYFESVVFSIIDNKHTDNYKIFKKCLHKE